MSGEKKGQDKPLLETRTRSIPFLRPLVLELISLHPSWARTRLRIASEYLNYLGTIHRGPSARWSIVPPALPSAPFSPRTCPLPASR